MTAQSEFITKELLQDMSAFLRLANYLGAAQLYLKDNYLLQEPLQPEHIKNRILGHWGTVPGLNFIYLTLNILTRRHAQQFQFVAGPGHGYPAILANLYLEGTLGEYYPDYKLGLAGMSKLIHDFSWPGGFPSHSNPETPGVILEGGELGYALATSFGVAFDNPDLVVACVIGDGEAETAATATAWHSNKYLNPERDGAVLPIVHINKYKISGPTIYGTMSNAELTSLFQGYGYEPMIVEGDFLYEPMLLASEQALQKIKEIQTAWRSGERTIPRWPVILLKTKKGWTGPRYLHGQMVEDSFRSHGIPITDISDPESFQVLEEWLSSYHVTELLDTAGKPKENILNLLPPEELRMGRVPHAHGGMVKVELKLPDIAEHALHTAHGQTVGENVAVMGKYLRDVIELNPDNFRVFSPDETESNKLQALFEVTNRCYIYPVPAGAENLTPDGRIMEMLSENTLQGWLEGYILSGRHGVFVSYEAFFMIIASMVDQYEKFLHQSERIAWRKPLPAMNFVITSSSWRQDHNGFSHQNPGFISSVLNQHSKHVNVYFPPDANSLLVNMTQVLHSADSINLIVTGKRKLPQYLTMPEARVQMNEGVAIWEWAGNNSTTPGVVFAASGDYALQEVLIAMDILKTDLPELNTRLVYVSEISCFGIGDNHVRSRINLEQFHVLFGHDVPILYSYHGYPEDIKMLVFNHPDAPRFHVYGYIEQGTTTTPFDMQVQNGTSRYHLVLEALRYCAKSNQSVQAQMYQLQEKYLDILKRHKEYIVLHGDDMPEILHYRLQNEPTDH